MGEVLTVPVRAASKNQLPLIQSCLNRPFSSLAMCHYLRVHNDCIQFHRRLDFVSIVSEAVPG